MDKETFKFFRRRAGFIVLRGFTFFHGILPLGWSYFLGWVLGSLIYLALGHHRKIALESLAVAFPQASLKEKKKIARGFFIFMAQSGLEMLFFLKNPQALDGVRIEGGEHLDKAVAQGRGVIVLTAHIGNFPLMSLKLAQAGYPTHFVTRPMRDPQAGDYFHNLRTNAGVKTIFSYPRRVCVNGILDALKVGELVLIQMDQNFGTGGIWVKFFGRLAATPPGPVVFALKTKAVVLPAYIYREGKGKHCIKIFPAQPLILKEDKDETILRNVISFSRIIEGWIKQHPAQWGWIHRRWKSRPGEKVRKMKFKVEEE